MLRFGYRRFSISNLNKFHDSYNFQSMGMMLPPVEYSKMPKIGVINSSFEVFRDFAIDSINIISESGLGVGAGLFVFSIGMRAIFSPFILMTQINSWKIQLLAPEEAKIRSELISAYKVRDRVKIDKWNQATKLLYMKYKINPRINMIPLLQLPPVLFFFWTLQEMAYNIDKYPGMTTDGLLWFKNLSEADPYFVLPFLLALTNFWSIHKNPSTTQVKGSFGKYIKYLKYGAFLGFPITSSFPAAIVLNWFFMSFFQIIINSLIYTRLGRKLLKIPQYLPGSILEKYNTQSKTPVIKPQTYQHKPNITKTS